MNVSFDLLHIVLGNQVAYYIVIALSILNL